MKNALIAGILTTAALFSACGDAPTPEEPTSNIDHFAWVSDQLARGAQPKSDAAFQELAEAGIKTVISVDGARPDVAAAEKHGLRYVHIPFGYDGVPREQQLELAKTVRELDGPFFVHCHHGKHRGPAGAVLAQMTLGGMSPEEAVAELERAGTAARYTGLYACAREFAIPQAEETEMLEFDFPATAPVPALTEAMATIDRRWDGMKLVEGSGWTAPAGHPDIAPAHEALQLRELLTELERTGEVAGRPDDFRAWLTESRVAAERLEDALRKEPVDGAAAAGAFGVIKAGCKSCHEKYRNTQR